MRATSRVEAIAPEILVSPNPSPSLRHDKLERWPILLLVDAIGRLVDDRSVPELPDVTVYVEALRKRILDHKFVRASSDRLFCFAPLSLP